MLKIDPTVGQPVDSQVHKAHTIAVSERVKFTLVISLNHITKPVCTAVSKSAVLTPKSCLLNGNSKLVPVKVLRWVIIFGWHVISLNELQRNSVSRFLFILNLSKVIGMVLDVILMFQPLKHVNPELVCR